MTDKLRKLTIKIPVLTAAVCVFLALLIFHLDKWIFGVDFFYSAFHISETSSDTIKRIITTLICMLFITNFMNNNLKDAGYKAKCGKDGYKTAIFIIIFSVVLNGLMLVVKVRGGTGHFVSTPEEISALIEMIIACFIVGIFEETAYRVIPINILRNKKGFSDRKLLAYSLVISAVLFGLIHLPNIFGGYETPAQGLVTILNAFGFGILLGSMYWKTGSIIPSILAHFVWDACNSTNYLYITPVSDSTSSSSGIIFGLVMMAFWIIISLIVIRKKKYKGCQIAAITIRDQLEKENAGSEV